VVDSIFRFSPLLLLSPDIYRPIKHLSVPASFISGLLTVTMAEEAISVWMYEPSFPLAVIGCVVYGLILFAIGYFTLVKYRLWYFSVIVVGAAVEVVAYVTRAYSAKNQSEIVRCSNLRKRES
jgi:uncharacterized membrane protein